VNRLLARCKPVPDHLIAHVIPSLTEALVIVGEAVGEDINPAQENHQHAAHETGEERYDEYVRCEEENFIGHKPEGGIVGASSSELDASPHITELFPSPLASSDTPDRRYRAPVQLTPQLPL
jgi:hypothetical protein